MFGKSWIFFLNLHYKARELNKLFVTWNRKGLLETWKNLEKHKSSWKKKLEKLKFSYSNHNWHFKTMTWKCLVNLEKNWKSIHYKVWELNKLFVTWNRKSLLGTLKSLENLKKWNPPKKSRTRGYKTPVPVKGTGCDQMNILWPNDSIIC